MLGWLIFVTWNPNKEKARCSWVQESCVRRAIQTCFGRGGDGREGPDGEQAVLGGCVRGGRRAGRLQHLPRRLLRQQPLHGLHLPPVWSAKLVIDALTVYVFWSWLFPRAGDELQARVSSPVHSRVVMFLFLNVLAFYSSCK
jgi:hypothetical protein